MRPNRIYYAVCMTPQPEAGLPDDKRRESAEREKERGEKSAMREEWRVAVTAAGMMAACWLCMNKTAITPLLFLLARAPFPTRAPTQSAIYLLHGNIKEIR